VQLVGYRHVLTTLWSISDVAAPTMAYVTYAYLLSGRCGAMPEIGRSEPFGAELPLGGRVAPVTLANSESDRQHPEVAVYLDPADSSLPGLLRAPQNPHKSAARRPNPTGIPRTKRHTPVHLL
jgi:hypothetical protein